MENKQNKIITCCELRKTFQRYYQKKFGVDGLSLFVEENPTIELVFFQEIFTSLFNYFKKQEKLCSECANFKFD